MPSETVSKINLVDLAGRLETLFLFKKLMNNSFEAWFDTVV